MANQDDFIRTALRVPPSLHKQLHDAAKTANRTFNAEIVDRLQASFQPPAGVSQGQGEAWEGLASQLMQAQRTAARSGVALVNAVAALKKQGFADEELLADWQERALDGAMQAVNMLPVNLADLEDLVRRIREGKAAPPWISDNPINHR
jgi:hypothetical protein